MGSKLNLAKFLTTTSALALAFGASGTVLASDERYPDHDPANFGNNSQWTPIFAYGIQNNDYINTSIGVEVVINANIAGRYVADFSGDKSIKNLVASVAGLQFGNITTPYDAAYGEIELGAGANVTLVGGDHNDRTTAADYSGLNGVDFSAAGSVLNIDTNVAIDHEVSGNAAAGAGDAITYAGAVSNGANGTLNVNTDLIVSGPSWLTIGSINIGSGSGAATLRANLTAASAVDGSTMTFVDADSELYIDSSSDINLSNNLGGATDVSGRMTINAGTNDITVNDSGNGQFGVSGAQRFNALSVSGSKNTAIEVPVYAKYVNATGDAGSTLYFRSDVEVGELNIGDGTVALDNNNGEYKFGSVNDLNGNNSQLSVLQSATLKATGSEVNIGTSLNRINDIYLADSAVLTVEDGINIYAGTITNSFSEGVIKFQGTNIFDLQNAPVNLLWSIDVEDNADLTINVPSLYLFNGMSIGNNATLRLQTDFNSDITPNNTGNGTLIFSNPGAVTLTGDVGSVNNRLNTIEFAGSDVNIDGTVTHTDGTFRFTSANPMQLTLDANSDVGDASFENASAVDHAIVLNNAATNFTRDITTSGGGFLNFQLGNGINAEITANDASGAGFITRADGKGELNLNSAGITINSVGASAASLAKLTFTENATINKDIYASEISIADNKTATFGGNVETKEFKVGSGTVALLKATGSAVNIGTSLNRINSMYFPAGAVLSVEDGINIYADTITNSANNVGAIKFQGTNVLDLQNAPVNRLNYIDVEDNADLTINAPSLVLGSINIGSGSGAATLRVNLTAASALDGSDITFANENSELYLDSSGAISLSNSLSGATDVSGIMAINAATNNVVVNDGTNGRIGASSTQRLKELSVSGSNDTTINVPVYVKSINATGDAGSTLSFGGNVETEELNIGDGIVALNNNNGEYTFGSVKDLNGNSSQLSILQSATLKATGSEVNIGTSLNRIKSMYFPAGAVLTVEDDINIYAGTITNSANNIGAIKFQGTNILDLETTPARKLSYIDVEDNADLTINAPSLALDRGMSIGNNATLRLKQDFISDITSNNTGNGTLIFSNPGAVTLTGALGSAKERLNIVEFAGNDVNIDGTVIHTDGTFRFTSANPMQLTLDANSDVGDASFENASAVDHSIVLNNASTNFTRDITISGGGILDFQLDDGVNAEVTANDVSGAIFTTRTDGKGELNLNSAGITISNFVGSSGSSLGKLSFTESATITKDIYASEISIADNKTATFVGGVTTGKYSFGGANAIASFYDGATINSTVAGSAPGGVAIFAGDASIQRNIGSMAAALDRVEFVDNSAKKTTLAADIYATDIVTKKGAVALTTDVKMVGDVSVNSTKFDLADHKLDNTGSIAMSGINTINFNMVDNGAGSTITGGALSSTGVLTLGNGSILILQPQDQSITVSVGEPRKFSVVSAAAIQGVNAGQIQITPNNKSLNWKVSVEGNAITLTEDWDPALYLQSAGVKDQEALDALKKFFAAEDGSSGDKMESLLAELIRKNNTSKLNEAIDRITDAGEASADARVVLMSSVADALSNRILTLDAISLGLESTRSDISGVAAGDDRAHIGAWVSPFFGRANQGARGDLPGYTNQAYGASFGVDTRLSEDSIIGVALTVSNSNIKHKGIKKGDRTRMNSFLYSMYGLTSIANGGFLLGSVTFGESKVQNHSRRVVSDSDYETANSKHSADSFSAKSILGYNRILGKAVVSPMFGFKYTRSAAVSYNETGAAFENLEISAKARHQIDAIAGVKSTGVISCNDEGRTITPEVRGFVDYNLSNHAARQTIKMGNSEFISSSKKPARVKYNFGIGVNTECNGFEYSAGYDLHLSDKLVGHQGSLKIRADF